MPLRECLVSCKRTDVIKTYPYIQKFTVFVYSELIARYWGVLLFVSFLRRVRKVTPPGKAGFVYDP